MTDPLGTRGTDGDTPLSDAEIERALAQLRRPHPVPLSYAELESIRRILRQLPDTRQDDLDVMLTEWKFKQEKAAEWKRRWPLLVTIISVLGTAATVSISIIVNFVQSGGHKQ